MIKRERFAALASEVAREVVRRRSSEACCGDLTLEQFETLQIVDRTEQSSIGSLSATMEVDLSTMSRNVSVLEKNGYLQRVRSADDRRLVHVRLTAKGRSALTTLRCSESDVLGEIYERIPPGERAAVVKGLEALRRCLLERETATACCSPSPSQRRPS
jgi:DNA-binding MarR family transcriptional regulator